MHVSFVWTAASGSRRHHGQEPAVDRGPGLSVTHKSPLLTVLIRVETIDKPFLLAPITTGPGNERAGLKCRCDHSDLTRRPVEQPLCPVVRQIDRLPRFKADHPRRPSVGERRADTFN